VVVTTAIITRKNKVLVGKVSEERLSDFAEIPYIFPGGKVEENETMEEAVTREAREETNLLVEVIHEIASRMHPKTQTQIHYFHCKYLGGDARTNPYLDDDIDEFVWVNVNEIETYMPTIFSEVLEYLKELKEM
jgi:8-oxo-dGTP diphosphatase